MGVVERCACGYMCVFLSVIRYCEFLLLHYDISQQSVRPAHVEVLSSQLARLLNCTLVMDGFAQPAPSSGPSSPSSASSEDSCDAASLSAKLAGLTVTEPAGLSTGVEDHVSSFLWLSQTLRLLSISGRSGLCGVGNTDVVLEHAISRVKKTESILSTAGDLLTSHLKDSEIELSPVGVPSLIKPPVSASKVKGRGKKVTKAFTKVPCLRLVGFKVALECIRARCLLAKRCAVLAQKVLTDALAEVALERRGPELSLLLGELHYYMGVALAQQLEDEALTQQLEGEGERTWFEVAEGPLYEQCIEEFMTCYQLCFPVMPTILLRETCLWLSLLLPNTDHAHHFLSLSQHISLMHQTVLSLGKKLR